MTSKTIEIDEETYNRLLKKKKNNETISEVIEKLLGPPEKKEKNNLRAFFGRWNTLPKDYFEIMEDAHKEFRNELSKRFQ